MPNRTRTGARTADTRHRMRHRRLRPRVVALGAIALAAWTSASCSAVERAAGIGRPARREPTDDRVKTLRLPPGFTIAIFARDLDHARMLLAADDGSVLLTRPRQGDVLRLRDRDGDGRADEREAIVRDLDGVHGIALRDGQLYLATPTTVYVVQLDGAGTARPRALMERLPAGAQHPHRTMDFGRDGALYVSIGSSCNACQEKDPEHATMLRADAATGERRIFARGLRNTIGFAWHPRSAELWGMDHGSDWRGNDVPPEELNRLVDGKNYGWPWVHGKRVVDTRTDHDPPGTTKAGYAPRTEPSVLEYQAHSAPIGMVFYTGTQFPPEYRGDAFVAMHGSWNRVPPIGYKIVRIGFEGDRPVEAQDFVTGFLAPDGESHFGRPAGITVAKDGALLFSDDTNGVIYRVTYRKEPP